MTGEIPKEEEHPTGLESAARELETAHSEMFGEKIEFTPVEIDKPDSVLLWTMANFEMSARTAYCLADANIVCIDDLVRPSEAELLEIPSFNSKVLHEVKEILAGLGLHLAPKCSEVGTRGIEELFKHAQLYPILNGNGRSFSTSRN